MQIKNPSLKYWFFILPYLVLLYVGLYLTILVRYHGTLSSAAYQTHLKVFSVLFIIWFAVFFAYGLFELENLRRYTQILYKLLSSMAVNFLFAVVFFYFQPNFILTPRRFLIVDVAISFTLLLFWSILLKYFVSSKLQTDLYLYGDPEELKDLENEIRAHGYLGFVLKGFYISGQTEFDERRQSMLIVSDDLRTDPKTITNFYDLKKRGVAFLNHKDFYEKLLRRVYLAHLNELWFLENIDYQEKRVYNFIKRLVDIVLGLVLFAVFLVTYPVIALLIKLTSSGPVLFIQPRIGKSGKVFRVYKYRTMQNGSDNSGWKKLDDARVTAFGKFLRAVRADELPQSINLLFGNMSLVGPRPEQVEIVNQLHSQIPFYNERHLVKPGLSGWAQLHGYAANLEQTKLKLQYDLYYIKNRSVLFDLEVILKTFYHVFTGKGE